MSPKPWAAYAKARPPPPARPLAAIPDDEPIGVVALAGYLGCSIGAVQQARLRGADQRLRWDRSGRYPVVFGREAKVYVARYRAEAEQRAVAHAAREAARAAYAAVLKKTAPAAPKAEPSAAPRLHKDKCFAPVTVGTTRIARLAETAEYLTQSWPAEAKGLPSYRTALLRCQDVYLGRAAPDEARRALIVAAQDAGIAVTAG